MRLLIVEDEQDLALGLRFNLEQEGYQVDLAENGEDALQMLLGEHRREYDLVVLDAQRLEEGPLATVRLPTRIPGQVHGWWVPGSTLPATRL